MAFYSEYGEINYWFPKAWYEALFNYINNIFNIEVCGKFCRIQIATENVYKNWTK